MPPFITSSSVVSSISRKGMSTTVVVRNDIVEAQFGLYTEEEIVASLSVCKITSPLREEGKEGGLYDSRMGATTQQSLCVTCGSVYVNCPGHPGHIELDLPVYNPILFGQLYKLLRSKCAYCHKFRISLHKVRCYLVKLKLIEMGDLANAESLQESYQFTSDFDLDGIGSSNVHAKMSSAESKSTKSQSQSDVEAQLSHYEDAYNRTILSRPLRLLPESDKAVQQAVIDEFIAAVHAAKKCENCGLISPSLRKDGSCKIFQKPPSKRSNTVATVSALETIGSPNPAESITLIDDEAEEDDDAGATDEDDDDDTTAGALSTASSPSSLRYPPSSGKAKNAKSSTSSDGAVTLDKYLAPTEVEAQLRLLWQHHKEILDFVWGRSMRRELERRRLRTSLQSPSSLKKSKAAAASQDSGIELWKIFFLRAVLVPPNRYRPLAKIGEEAKEHPQNMHLTKIIESNMRIRLLQHGVDTYAFQKELIQSQNEKANSSKEEASGDLLARLLETSEKDKQSDKSSSNLSKLITTWIDLQNAVNCYMDSAKDPNPLNKDGPAGIRQLLEKKEGLFRRHMMGKRVNFCCRSVISPDPYIGTNEIGIPMHFASQLNYPTHVNVHNVKYLRNLVERGPTNYPGANQIEMGNGQIINLERLTKLERAGKAKMLLSSPGVIVHRHLMDGDVLLVNRQPTLHRAGIMAHKARILRHVREQTLRLGYANCSSYNADFDGDEMNCHFMQNELARAEANVICNTDNQYIVPTSGNPVRGLIQDHVASGVKLTCKDTFLNRAQYQQLLYVALSGLPGTEITTYAEDIRVPTPTIWKPERLWTGKQVISALIIHLCPKSSPQLLHLDAKTKTPASAFGEEQMEHEMIIRHGELLTGVVDKGAIGNTSMGLVHAVFELYGAETAGKLLNALGRLLTFFLQDAGQSCGIQDLVLNRSAEEERLQLLRKVSEKAATDLDGFLPPLPTNTGKKSNKSERKRFVLSKTDELNERVNLLMSTGDRREAKVRLDGEMQKSVNDTGSKVIKACIPHGLQLSFQVNNFSMMVLTGAKGSAVNQSQISCLLGQQALEGQRVPIMISGKSLPSFKPFDASPRAGGFVRDRFLTGVKPQEYYFHCMAGREGLVDTAVKTSRSGYLQRCLVKHLEELKVHYDFTVRDSSNAIVQFNYGEDGLDPTQAALLGGNNDQMLFLARNCKAIAHKHGVSPDYFSHEDDGGLQYKPAQDHHNRRNSALELIKKAATNKANGVIDLFNSGLLIKGSVVRAKRKIFSSAPWSRGNLLHHWETATVTKVRSKSGQQLVDLEYVDGYVEKKVPICLWIPSTDKGAQEVPVFLLRPGLPDPAMSYLPLGNTVGACSEMIQQALNAYIEKNPHGIITAEDSPTAIHAKSLEMLLWVKYMRSLASPGDAVGCIAAQSVGEPSTQMTLNTFHLAGHGGANVTLGIPRLREIIMTASKTLKTPTMTIPLRDGKELSQAKFLARKLCQLPLIDLLDHRAGIVVKEEIVYARDIDSSAPWQRQYSIRLVLENMQAIHSTFDISFEDILHVVKSKFSLKLQQILRSEQRKVGEKASGKTLDAFKSTVKNNEETGSGKNSDKDSDAGDNDAGGEEGGDNDDDATASTSRKKAADSDDSSDEEEDAVGSHKEEEDDDTRVNKEGQEYENDVDEDDDNLDSEKEKMELDVEADDDDDDDEVSVPSKKPAAKKSVRSKAADVSPSKSSRRKDSSKAINSDDLNFNHEDGWIEIQFSFPAAARRLLMAPLAEKAAQACMVRSTPNIKYSYVMPKASDSDGIKFVTDGVNFEAIWSLSDEVVNMNAIDCNDIWRISQTFGIEAARLAIVKEIKTVFGAYGINVNARHLSLIADFMTRRGTFSAMNRAGMNDCPSPYLQMSFETTCTFLTKAAIEGAHDTIQSPSASIVMGSVAKVGTGCFDLMVPLGDQ